MLRYAVDSVTTYTKSTLKDSPVWDVVPNRLVLISCYTEDPWGKNVVVVAIAGPRPVTFLWNRQPAVRIMRQVDQHVDHLATLKT